jgi:hypothetical protein
MRADGTARLVRASKLTNVFKVMGCFVVDVFVERIEQIRFEVIRRQ